MRLWSLDSKYLDPLGLSRNYFEGIRGFDALMGFKLMWKNHSQLQRFRSSNNPEQYFKYYLKTVLNEAKTRNLDWAIQSTMEWFCEDYKQSVSVSEGQIEYEIAWLLHKMRNRKKVHQKYIDLLESERHNIKLHPLFYKVSGEIESWERVKEFS